MNWISIKDKKPADMCSCWVVNNRHSAFSTFEAFYYADLDVFVLYDPDQYHHPCIDVTHYIIKPDVPKHTVNA